MIRYVSRSAIETDWRCPRARYYLTEHGGTGCMPVKVAEELRFGSIVHAGTEHLHNGTWGLRALEIGFSPELNALASGLLWGYKLLIFPRLLEQYEILHIEQELSIALTEDIALLIQPDLLVRDKQNGSYGYIEFKTTKWANVGWVTSWEKQPQLHAGLRAAREQLGLPFEWAIVQGFHKSQPHKKTGRLMSPLVWAYIAGNNTYSVEWKRDWEPFECATYKGKYGVGIEGWVRYLLAEHPEELAGCFPVTAPIFEDTRLTDRFLEQTAVRELDIDFARTSRASCSDRGRPGTNPEYLDDVLLKVALRDFFPQHFTSCQHGNYRCAYYEACHLIGNRDPLDTDIFVKRIPHHETEAFALSLEEEVF